MDASSEGPNAAILTAANTRGWFVAHKVAAVWARQLTEDTIVKTREGALEAKAGDYLCRGPDGGRWPQSESSLRGKYAPTDEVDADGFRRWEPQPDRARVFASPIADDVELVTDWGVMRGVAGDLLVGAFVQDASGPGRDVWIVEKAIFEATYERLDGPADA